MINENLKGSSPQRKGKRYVKSHFLNFYSIRIICNWYLSYGLPYPLSLDESKLYKDPRNDNEFIGKKYYG